MLIILVPEDKIRTSEEIDQHISAEIPDKECDEELYNLVTKQMIHGPCGKINPCCPCMIKGRCKANFPQQFRDATDMGTESYALYRRRNDGVKFRKYIRIAGRAIEVTFDNRDVIAYSPKLLKFIKAHCNVEVCATVKACKYLYKYVHKGPDRAEVEACTDEIKRYIEGRYLGPCEACHRIFGFHIHNNEPAVVRLQVHLQDKQTVTFSPLQGRDNLQATVNQTPAANTTLTAWFKKNREQDGISTNLLYYEMPEKYTWNKDKKEWIKRKNRQKAIGRMYWVTPRTGEQYYLRVLLVHVRGATSFDDLRTVNGITYETYKEACLQRDLLIDDNEPMRCMSEATIDHMPSALRNLFAIILIYNNPVNPLALWNQFKRHLSEDIQHRNSNWSQAEVDNECLLLLKDILQRNGKELGDFHLPIPHCRVGRNRYIQEEQSYDIQQMQSFVDDNYNNGTSEQKDIYNQIIEAETRVRHNRHTSDTPNIFFIDACAGSGKSWTINLILAKVRADGGIALATASSGIAALLLKGGGTAHSTFKIPFNITFDSTCHVSKQSDLAKLLKISSLIVWDEITMSHKHAIEAVDRLFRDLMNTDVAFGGKVVVFSGDFRQCLPVIRMGNEASIVGASIKGSYIWDYVQNLKLTQNMRVLTQTNSDNANRQLSWANWLLSIGNGTVSNPINLDVQDIHHCDSIDHLIYCVYGDTNDYSNKAIVTGLRKDVDEINELMLNRNEGRIHEYYSIDSPQKDEDEQDATTLLPEEFLNTLTPQGFPPHKLCLKVGSPIMLMRNLNKAMGLANGTRLIVNDLRPSTIKAVIVTQGAFYNTEVIIPRIDLITDNKELPFQFRRRQFPVQLAYSMTIHKSQGQSFQTLGIYIGNPLFTHGQLYVALSRVGRAGGVFMHVLNENKVHVRYTENVIYKSALEPHGYISTANDEIDAISLESDTDSSIHTENHQPCSQQSIGELHECENTMKKTHTPPTSDSEEEDVMPDRLSNLQSSILRIDNYISTSTNPHSLTGSWAIIPFIHDVLHLQHNDIDGIRYYSDIAQDGLYDRLLNVTTTSFRERQITSNDLPWVRKRDGSRYLHAEVQEELLNFVYMDEYDNTQKNMGEVFETLLHDIINLISPPAEIFHL